MADNVRTTIAKLNNGNYSVWKYKMELLLIKEDLWDVVAEPRPLNADANWTKQDGRAKAAIGLMVEDGQLQHIRKENTAKGAWDALNRYHQKSTLTNKVFLLKRLCGMKLVENGDMEIHVNAMLDLVDDLISLGETLAEHLIVAFLLCSLPDSYSTLITALESRPEQDLTLELVKGKLIHEYKRRMETNDDTAVKELALRIHDRELSTGNRQNNQKEKRKCFFCKRIGHLKRDCRKFAVYREKHKQDTYKVNTANSCSSSKENNNGYSACFKAVESLPTNEWYIDSGATTHMTNDRAFFITKLRQPLQRKVFMANRSCCYAKGIGDGVVTCEDGFGEFKQFFVKDVLYVPDLGESLLSVDKLLKNGLAVKFANNSCTIEKDNIIVATTARRGQLFVLKRPNPDLVNIVSTSITECQHIWHRRLGHRDINAVKLLEMNQLATGIQMENCCETFLCDSCIRGKMSRLPFPQKSNNDSKAVMDLVHTDICGPMQTVTPGGKRYILTFIDDFSRYTVTYLLAEKSETLYKLKEYVEGVKTKFGSVPKFLRSDRGGEYTGKNFQEYLKANGIRHQMTTPYSPQQNGVAERKNRSIIEMARCMLTDAEMHNRYWGEAVATATYIQNRLSTKAIDCTPYERWNNRIPNISHMKIFGCNAYMWIPKEKRRKLDETAIKLKFVGYAEGTKGYRLLDMKTDRVYISRDVRFHESSQGIIDNCNKKTRVHDQTKIGIEIPMEQEEIEDDSKLTNIEQTVRSSSRINKGVPPLRFIDEINIAREECQSEPKTIVEAFASPNKTMWEKAVQEELESLREHRVWDLVDLPEGRKAIGCKWVFKVKHSKDGNVDRFKARLVAQGFSQQYGEDYDQVFAPVAKQTTLRALLTVAGKRKMQVKHFDIKTAFLHGDLQQEIFMKQPPGCEHINQPTKVCRLNKSIYGLKQAARVWNQKVNDILLAQGFVCSETDQCLYSKQIKEHWMYILIYVDDIIVASSEKQDIDDFEKTLGTHIDITCLGDLQFYLGMQIERCENGIFSMHLITYIERMLVKFGLKDAKSSKIPLDPQYMKQKEDNTLLPNNENYRRAIGALLYIAVNTRPDISAAVSILARKTCSPNERDWFEVKRVFRYLKGTLTLKLKLGDKSLQNQEFLYGYVDADWAGNPYDRKSNSGYLFKFFGGTISWACRKQTSVSLSSTEAEFIALSVASQEALWLQRLLQDLHLTDLSIRILEDNQSCLKMLKNEGFNQQTKHIDTCQKEMFEYCYCPTEEMVADILTKPLNVIKIVTFRKELGLV